MHIGDQKSNFVEKAIEKSQKFYESDIFVEVGSYCGYSAIKIASCLRENGKLYCIEASEKCVKWTRRMLELARLSDRVEVLHGEVFSVLTALKLKCSYVNFLFLDHDKSKYLSDLLLFEQSHLLQAGAVILADNILSFNQPMLEYINHVRSSTFYSSSELHPCRVEYSDPDNSNRGGARNGNIGANANLEEDQQGDEDFMADGMELSVVK